MLLAYYAQLSFPCASPVPNQHATNAAMDMSFKMEVVSVLHQVK